MMRTIGWAEVAISDDGLGLQGRGRNDLDGNGKKENQRALEKAAGKKTQAAKIIDISSRQLYSGIEWLGDGCCEKRLTGGRMGK